MNESKSKLNSKENTGSKQNESITTNCNSEKGRESHKRRPRRNCDRSRIDSKPETGTLVSKPSHNSGSSDIHVEKGSVNEPEWYIWDEANTKGYADFSFNVKPGIKYQATRNSQIMNSVQVNNLSSTRNYQMPGIAIYKYIPLYGNSTDPQSALNVVSQQIWKRVRNLLSNNQTRYTAADMFMYIMAMDQIYLMIHEVKRIFRLCNTFTNENREIPKKILNALGFDFDEVVNNLANYRTKLNIIIGDINTLYVPDIFDVFKRRAVLGQSVIMDDSSKPGQLIIPDSSGYMLFDPVLLQTGSALSYVDKIDMFGTDKYLDGTTQARTTSSMTYTKFTMDKVLSKIGTAVQTLTLDEEITMISGDMARAFDGQLYSIPYLGEDEIVDLITDDNVREQFKNSLVLDIPGANYSDTIAAGTSKKTPSSGIQNINLSPLRFSCSAPTGYVDPIGQTAAKNQKAYTMNKPVIYQDEGSVYCRATIYTCNNASVPANPGPNNISFRDTSIAGAFMSQVQVTNIASSLMLSTYLLDVYSEQPDWKLNLEWTRLMTIVTPSKDGLVNNTRGNFTYKAITNYEYTYEREHATSWNMDQTLGNAHVELRDIGTVHYGTELGLGWLVYAGFNSVRDGLNLPTTVSDDMITRSKAIVLSQWYQFNSGTLGEHNTALSVSGAGELFAKSEVTILMNFTMNSSNQNGDNTYVPNGINKYNLRDVDAMIRGLDYAPRSYNAKSIGGNANRTTPTIRYSLDFSMESGKFGNKTAELSEKNIMEVHEAAFNGLFRKRL